MRAWIIKYKGKTWWGNILFDLRLLYPDNTETNLTQLFFKKKDVMKYFNTLKHKEFYEVCGVTIDKSKEDNRRKK